MDSSSDSPLDSNIPKRDAKSDSASTNSAQRDDEHEVFLEVGSSTGHGGYPEGGETSPDVGGKRVELPVVEEKPLSSEQTASARAVDKNPGSPLEKLSSASVQPTASMNCKYWFGAPFASPSVSGGGNTISNTALHFHRWERVGPANKNLWKFTLSLADKADDAGVVGASNADHDKKFYVVKLDVPVTGDYAIGEDKSIPLAAIEGEKYHPEHDFCFERAGIGGAGEHACESQIHAYLEQEMQVWRGSYDPNAFYHF